MHAALSFNLLYGRSCMGVKMSKVKITDGFWKAEQELVRTEVIPYQWDALNDNVKDAAPSYCMRNFRIAGEVNKKRREAGYKEIKYPIPRDKWEFLPGNREETFARTIYESKVIAGCPGECCGGSGKSYRYRKRRCPCVCDAQGQHCRKKID